MDRLIARRLSIGYAPRRRPRTVVASGLDLTLRTGDLVCLLGPNGAGKSTLMRTLAGAQPPLSGGVELDGQDLHDVPSRERARRVSVVLTERVDAGHLTVRTLVSLGRYPHTNWAGTLTAEDERAVEQAIAAVDAGDLAGRPVNELSDGERQKVLIARALAQETSVILLDEPTAFLDLPRRVEVVALLRRLSAETGRAILLSTHDLDLALRNADTIWLMSGGRILTGIPEALVLDGAFADAFDREGVRFDPDSGAFRVEPPHRGSVRLRGTGPTALWTGRALERLGFDLRSGSAGADHVLSVDFRNGRPLWTWRTAGGESAFDTLESLVGHLRSLRSAPRTPDPARPEADP